MILGIIEIKAFATNCYLVGCPESREAAIIDPGGEASRILQLLRKHQLKGRYVINTHGHVDHIAANGEIKKATGADLLIHRVDALSLTDAKRSMLSFLGKEAGPPADRELDEGDVIEIGHTVRLKVIHTPGHTPGGICLAGDGLIFTGDTLFAGSIGRTDFPGGSYESLINSIKEKLLCYDDQVEIYPGHGPRSTIGEERKYNPFLR
jgi:hydroxyacylglutathione hydrolase